MKKILLTLAGLLGAAPALAQTFQDYSAFNSGTIGAMMAYSATMMIVWLACYIVMAIGIMKLAKKFNTPNPWMAWIPVLNIWLMIQIAGLEWWWILIVFAGIIPVIGWIAALLAGLYIWLKIVEKAGKPQWFVILMLIPLVNIWAIFELSK